MEFSIYISDQGIRRTINHLHGGFTESMISAYIFTLMAKIDKNNTKNEQRYKKSRRKEENLVLNEGPCNGC